jgi:hypothetical protein
LRSKFYSKVIYVKSDGLAIFSFFFEVLVGYFDAASRTFWPIRFKQKKTPQTKTKAPHFDEWLKMSVAML